MSQVVVTLDLEQDQWVDSRKRSLGLKRRAYVLRNLVREAMLLEQQFDEQKNQVAQEEFKN